MADTRTAARRLRIAAAGDIHCDEDCQERIERWVAGIPEDAQLLLLCGDLTTHGRPEQASVLAQACRELTIPAVAVLGNHDWHSDQAEELSAVLREAGIAVLEREATSRRVDGVDVGIVGLKGFVGGFAGSHLPDFGEPLLRSVYQETSRDVDALGRGLRQIALCQVRIVVLHYAPTVRTIAGESEGIWAFLGTDRLAAPIAEHEPDLVVHGHAHAGTFAGAIGATPVYNVSVPVIQRDLWMFEVEVRPSTATVH